MRNMLQIIKEKTNEGASKIFMKAGEVATEQCCFLFNYEVEIPKELEK